MNVLAPSPCLAEGSPAYDEFLGLLGEKVRLMDWKKYRGGLDNKCEFSPAHPVFEKGGFKLLWLLFFAADTTGTHSIYRNWKDVEIMFHISTLLPFETANPQQLARKRHIGNVSG